MATKCWVVASYAAFAAAWVGLIVRNELVFRARSAALDEEHAWTLARPGEFRGRFVRYEALPSYARMLLTVWRRPSRMVPPLAGFYKEAR